MMVNSQRLRRRSRLLESLLSLGAAVAVCVVLPFFVQTAFMPQGWHDLEARKTAAAALAALVLGFWLYRNLGDLPGTRESSGILPSYTISFGLIFIVILMWRMPYSRAILIVSFLLSIGWFFLTYLITQRRRRLRLGIVEGGRVDLFDRMQGVEIRRLELDEWPDDVDAVTADFRCNHSDAWESRLADYVLSGIPVYHSKDLHESMTGRADLEHLSENNFGALGPQSSLLFGKSVLDRALALPALVLLLPLFAVTALAIRIDSPGPVLFRQRRSGYRGQDFTVIKFRTMRVEQSDADAEISIKRYITRPNDHRITRLGAFLRRNRIDELPQVINILRGEMSWIGPRPEASELSAWYQAEIPFYRYRSVVRPGISGWAQVNQGHVTDISDIKTKLQLDFYYIRNFSVWLDLLIVMKTIRTIITGFGHR